MLNRIRRKFKRSLENKGKVNSATLPIVFLILSLAIFCITQLSINSILSPLGKQLQSFNTEKDLLIQENREIEKDLANSQSISVIQNITNKKYNLKPTNTSQLVYVTPNVVASK
ncbi:hypothetical protein M0R04_00090 [Candidatus Dojkabacteria bacterium]|jgi:hypothetical protein|nr:hypothetical protein [Candidatus Dojkabacteria bacterium]